jgi:hypothetical protein
VSHVPPQHRTEVHGAPVTTVARTAVDLARKGPRRCPLSSVCDAALRPRAPREELEEALRVAKGWPGSRCAAMYVAFADARAESPLESVGRWRMHQLELPVPELQVPLFDAHGLMGYPDFLFAEQRVIAEADGLLKYAQDGALAREKQREDRFRDAGYEVFRFTWDLAVRRPAVLEQRALRAFARARERGVRAA